LITELITEKIETKVKLTEYIEHDMM